MKVNRRRFVESSAAAAGAAFIGAARASAAPAASAAQATTAATPKVPPSKADLEAIRARYRRYLFDDFLPFMDRHVIDREHGGFMCAVGHDGVRVNDRKSVWFEGRGIWVYAYLYTHFGREARYLDVARRSFDLVRRVRPAAGEAWPRELTREGQATGATESAIYGALFVSEGAAALAEATGDRAYRTFAREVLVDAMARYDRADYDPTIGQTYLGSEARPFPGARVQGVWMVSIRALTPMLASAPEPDPALQAIADRCVDAVVHRHFNPAYRLNNELLDHDLSRPQNEYARLVYTGHSIETLWMLLHEAMRRRDRALFDLLADRFRRHVEVAWDDVYGGVWRNLMDVEANRWTLDKVLWAQEEVLIGSLLVYEQTGAPWAYELFARALAYVEATFPLAAHGSPLWMYAGDRQVAYDEFLTRPRRCEHYHHPRHLMLNLQMLDRLIAHGAGRWGRA